MEMKKLDNQKGFTLVEIAIVLVIIGLLLGGVLKGQELIENAKIKAVTSDFDNISAAYYAYQDRTGNLPGDNDGSDNFDGSITDAQLWTDLRAEGFIGGSGAAGPAHDLSGVWSGGNGSDASNPFAAGVNAICASNIPETFAQGMDTKLDDGNSLTGNILAVRSDGTAGATGASGAYAAVETRITLCKSL